jgi:ATP-dependent DNA helicase DinG
VTVRNSLGSRYSVGMIDVTDVFGRDGLLARYLPGFAYRKTQEEMAHLIHDALARSENLAVEAGTGIGKTFAYLVPVLMSGRRAVISTGTLTLQDQLYHRDLPLLGSAIGRPVHVALLKGRANYLCWHRLNTAQHGVVRDSKLLSQLMTVAEWARATETGDLTEIENASTADHALRSWITSNSDNCLGSHCEFFDDCFLVKARRRAQVADVVVVNHHLLLADLALKDAGFGELLPSMDAVIVDEAHQLPEVAQQFFGVSLGSRELEHLARDINVEVCAAGLSGEIETLCDDLMRTASNVRTQFGKLEGRTQWEDCPQSVRSDLENWEDHLKQISAALAPARDINPGLQKCVERCEKALERLYEIQLHDRDGLKWVEVSRRSLTIHWTPLDIGAELGSRIESHRGTWVFTSATLAVGGSFDHFLGRVGVPETQTQILSSPFDYQSNARLYLPEGLPQPADADYIFALLSVVWPIVEATGGGVFMLFTSYRCLNEAREWLAPKKLPGPLLIQGDGPRTKILEQFRQSGNALLLGTSSFWHGVDVRGPSLRLVFIDKLPFASPGDPLMRSRLNAIRQEGGDPFNDFQLPQAILSLKQGVGRLIRDFSDRGLVIIGDPRLRTRNYGGAFLRSLPPIPIVDDHMEALSFADSLNPSDVRVDTKTSETISV